MSKYYFKNKGLGTKQRLNSRFRYEVSAYEENGGRGSHAIKNLNRLELQYYGLIDHNNFSVIPKEESLVRLENSKPEQNHRVLSFVAEAFKDLRLNFLRAVNTNTITKDNSALGRGDLEVVGSYESPKILYNKHLGNILNAVNERYSNKKLSINITSHKDYVNTFFKLIHKENKRTPITLSAYNKSYHGNVMSTGLAIKYYDIPFDHDQQKIESIVASASFKFFEKLCMNYGFSILHNNPNIIVFDVLSPGSKKYLNMSLDLLFNSFYEKTHVHDIILLNNTINFYYNNYVYKTPETIVTSVECNKTVQHKIVREVVNLFEHVPDYDIPLEYSRIRNTEEGSPYSEGKLKSIIKKASFLQKKFDNRQAIGYISREFKNQVWNRDFGYDDLTNRHKNKNTSSGGSGY